MLFYDAAMPAPNPRRVRMFLAEKGIHIPVAQLALVAGEHKAAAFLEINALGQVPALVLDNGDVLTESVAICRFFEELNPEPPLFGKGAKGRADVEMWTRRVELRLMVPLSMVWMHTHPYTARVVVPQFTEFGESNRPKVITALTYFNQILADRDYLTGAEFSIADIVLLTTIDFATFIGMALPAELTALKAWHERVSQRPSATA